MNTAAQKDLIIYKNATFNLNFTWKGADGNPINLTGYVAKMRIKENYSDSDADSIVYLTTENGGITLGGALGTVAITIDESVTKLIKPRSGVYDLLLTASGNNRRLLEGSVKIKPNAS